MTQSEEPRARATDRTGAEQELRAWPAPVLSRAELATAFAQALDLAEGRQPGHAARVCYIALHLAKALHLPRAKQRTVFFAALLHDAGAAPASSETCRQFNLAEEAIFAGNPGRPAQQIALDVLPTRTRPVVEALRAHVRLGADFAGGLGFDPAVRQAIAAHHERWDGHGYPGALKDGRIPVEGRILAAADLIESVIDAEQNPLAARRSLGGVLAEEAGAVLDPEIAVRAAELARGDAFWLGLHNRALTRELGSICPEEGADDETPADLELFARAFADLADAKGEFTGGHARRTAEIVRALCAEMSMEDEHANLVYLAALAHDIGLLGVPARVIAKPDILTLTEMETMRQHPTFSQMVLETLPGMEEVARWAGAHHERPDGRGYPEMLEGDMIPLEARVIAVTDTYVALTSTRPYRRALSHEDAQEVLLGGAGTQHDRVLVQLLCALPLDATSSRSAPRSRRKR